MGAAAVRRAASIGLANPPQRIDAASVFLIEGDLGADQIRQLAEELLADPVIETATIGATPPRTEAMIEVHPLPGVMDPEGEAIERAVHAILDVQVQVRTGKRYDFHGLDAEAASVVAQRCLANPVIHAVHAEPYLPGAFPTSSPYELRVATVALSAMDDEALERLSREAHLFLNLDEMKAIQAEYQRLGREPREIELETLAQTWSEHCVHKTLKATIRYCEDGASEFIDLIAQRPGHARNDDGSVTIKNLLKSTIAAATHELMNDGVDFCLSVFEDNAGVIAFDDDNAVCFKVETHNHPSAIEPYGGAATGIGGCIRDIIGTGLAARPIAATDVFCVAHPDHWTLPIAQHTDPNQKPLPAGCLHPRRILTDVVSGVRDYGNRMGIPTLNGAVWFDDDYVGNPLVYCGCVGVMPRDLVKGDANPGDRIIAIGGRTGRDGIHGATFSSAELTDTHADEFSHAVQIGNAVTEKKLLDAILEARDHADGCLFSAITDCGAGGFSSAVGEMGAVLGAVVNLEQAPLKYDGLSATEIWISEAQERMVLAVPAANVAKIRAICDVHDVELSELGHYGTDERELLLRYDGVEVGRLSMDFLHDGLPQTTREAVWKPAWRDDRVTRTSDPPAPAIKDTLLALLAHPNIASKRWIIRQYDHEVQGRSVVTPLVGFDGNGPSDAAVILPVRGSTRGLAIANGLATGLCDEPYAMTLAAIDECVRNLVCVGADPNRIAILDNFCWPSCDDPEQLGTLVRAAEACYDGAKAYRTPFISGKDSLNNQFTTEDGQTIRIPPTLLISGFGIVPDVRKCVTMDAKRAGNVLVYVGPFTEGLMAGSHFDMIFSDYRGTPPPRSVDRRVAPLVARTVHRLISDGLVESAHDVSDGGLLVAAAEMALAGGLGLTFEAAAVPSDFDACEDSISGWFCEQPARYLLEMRRDAVESVSPEINQAPNGFVAFVIGEFNDSGRVSIPDDDLDISIDELRAAWLGTLDW